MDDLLREFLTETSESIAILDVEILRFEKNPHDADLLSTIFRLVHTIKGTCGFLNLPRLEMLAHATESLLSNIRDGSLSVSSSLITLLLNSLDSIKSILLYLENHEVEPLGSDRELIDKLHNVTANDITPLNNSSDVILHKRLSDDLAVSIEKLDDHNITSTLFASSVGEQTIRVNINLLGHLMTAMSELVLTRNQLLQVLRDHKEDVFSVPLQRLNQITTTLQECVMRTRLQPIEKAWSKLPRMVRDLSIELNKKIDLQMIGGETELDRQILELVKDPLTHMVRNSADHGIEQPAERIASGKSETGLIILNAFHEGAYIIIEISDDGRGLDITKIKAQIIQKELASASDIEMMSDQQIMQYIFKPGFSTASTITSVSGRGVGMDVVKNNIEKIGGLVEFTSRAGSGSRFFIKIPLTLAIISALIVETQGQFFALPQMSIIELVKTSSHGEFHIEYIDEAPILRWKNNLLPLLYLHELLKIDVVDDLKTNELYVVILHVGNSAFGLIVDQIHEIEEIIVKPTPTILRHINMYSGNTILGDGRIVMILDINAITDHLGANVDNLAVRVQSLHSRHSAAAMSLNSMLLFEAGNKALKGVQLTHIAGLKDINCHSIEHINGRMVVQHNGKVIPLVAFSGSSCSVHQPANQSVLIFENHNKYIGLIVDRIIDIVAEASNIDITSHTPGTLGTSIISGRVVEVIDPNYYMSQTMTEWLDSRDYSNEYSTQAPHILLVDDSPFFRDLLVSLLKVEGYQVTAVGKAEEALQLQNEGHEFDVIVCDIELPDMNGFELASALRKNRGKLSQLPIIAISTTISAENISRSKNAGFTHFISKSDRHALLEALKATTRHNGAGA